MKGEVLWAFIRLILSLPLVLLAIYFSLRFLWGKGNAIPGSKNRKLEVLERVALTPKSGLAVVRCGEKYLLLGLGEGAPVLLTEIPDYPLWDLEGEISTLTANRGDVPFREAGLWWGSEVE